MFAERIMIKNPVTALQSEQVGDVLRRMREAKLRMLPVLDDDGVVVGIFSTFSILGEIVPSYIVSGDLNSVSYAPDLGVLRRHYDALKDSELSDMIDKESLMIKPEESLLSVATALIGFRKHEYALVVDEQKHLLGIISAGDILEAMHGLLSGEVTDA